MSHSVCVRQNALAFIHCLLSSVLSYALDNQLQRELVEESLGLDLDRLHDNTYSCAHGVRCVYIIVDPTWPLCKTSGQALRCYNLKWYPVPSPLPASILSWPW